MEHVMLGNVFCQGEPVVPTLFFMLSSQEYIHTTVGLKKKWRMSMQSSELWPR